MLRIATKNPVRNSDGSMTELLPKEGFSFTEDYSHLPQFFICYEFYGGLAIHPEVMPEPLPLPVNSHMHSTRSCSQFKSASVNSGDTGSCQGRPCARDLRVVTVDMLKIAATATFA